MNRLLDDVLDRAGDELTGAISDSVLQTVAAMFGRKIYAAGAVNRKAEAPPFAVSVLLMQEKSAARLRMVFDRQLLEPLVADVYSAEDLRNDAVLKDAASEIANVVGNRIKAFVNGKGFAVTMGFPEAEDPGKPVKDGAGVVSLDFSLNENAPRDKDILRVVIA